jgi:hypothetical protein
MEKRPNILFFSIAWWIGAELVLTVEALLTVGIEGLVGDLLAGGFYLIALLQSILFYFAIKQRFGGNRRRNVMFSIYMFFLSLIGFMLGYLILFSTFAGDLN